jgi:hypothetical protein
MICIYTKTELITKIKAIDLELNEAIESSKMDTNQTSSSYMVDVGEKTKQKNYYYAMLQQFYPGKYSGIINLNSKRR